MNLMHRSTFLCLRKQLKDLMPFNIIVTNFTSKMSALAGMVMVNLQVVMMMSHPESGNMTGLECII